LFGLVVLGFVSTYVVLRGAERSMHVVLLPSLGRFKSL
jgi:hypothetical protein